MVYHEREPKNKLNLLIKNDTSGSPGDHRGRKIVKQKPHLLNQEPKTESAARFPRANSSEVKTTSLKHQRLENNKTIASLDLIKSNVESLSKREL